MCEIECVLRVTNVEVYAHIWASMLPWNVLNHL